MSEEIKLDKAESKPAEVPTRRPVRKSTSQMAREINTSEDKITEAANKNDIEYLHKSTRNPVFEYERKMMEEVTGVFMNYENPGGTLRFSARPFKTKRLKKYELIDGHTYTLPRGIVIHLASTCSYPVHQNITNEKGISTHEVKKLVYRFGFQSTEFMGEDFKPRIERVEAPKIIKPVFI